MIYLCTTNVVRRTQALLKGNKIQVKVKTNRIYNKKRTGMLGGRWKKSRGEGEVPTTINKLHMYVNYVTYNKIK